MCRKREKETNPVVLYRLSVNETNFNLKQNIIE